MTKHFMSAMNDIFMMHLIYSYKIVLNVSTYANSHQSPRMQSWIVSEWKSKDKQNILDMTIS